MEEKKYAVLIDGDNISSKYLDSILNEMTKYGIATYKRIYCDDLVAVETHRFAFPALASDLRHADYLIPFAGGKTVYISIASAIKSGCNVNISIIGIHSHHINTSTL